MFIKIFQNVSKERKFLCWGLPMVRSPKGRLLPTGRKNKKRATAAAPSNTRKNNHNNLNLTKKNEFTLLKLKTEVSGASQQPFISA